MWDILVTVAWAGRIAVAVAVVVVGFLLWSFRAYDAGAPPASAGCACSDEYYSLDYRWRCALGSCYNLLHFPCDLNVSAVFVNMGTLVAWFFGMRTLRVPYDNLSLARAEHNFNDCGCVRGKNALVMAVRVGTGAATTLAGARVSGFCPTLVSQSPHRFIRADALASAGFCTVDGVVV